jgi:hypothetical protein
VTHASLVHQGPAAPRQTHVMLIGVGAYEHLPDGGGDPAEEDFGLGQLTSPPASARALADWFIEHFECPDRPLGTVRLLLSERNPATYINPRTGETHAIPFPTLAETKLAVTEWSEGQVSDDDQLIFYFCGHGLSGGVDELYPLRDFGRNGPEDDGPLARAINLNRFATSLATVRASNQLLILDTCREQEEFIEANNNDGARLIAARPTRRLGIAERMSQCVIHSTEPDSQARGRRGEASLCAQALMRALAGAAASRTGTTYHVRSILIPNAISDLQGRTVEEGYARQRSDTTRAANISVRRFIGKPDVPVFIRRQDGGSLAGSTVEHCPVGSGPPVRHLARTDEWEGALPIGQHRFVVGRRDPPDLDVEENVTPVYVTLEVP